jgi:hypothetical protein
MRARPRAGTKLAASSRRVNTNCAKNAARRGGSVRFSWRLKYRRPNRAESAPALFRNHAARGDSKIYARVVATASESNRIRCVFRATRDYVRDSTRLICAREFV